MATKMNMILSIVWTCCWIQIISGNPAEIMIIKPHYGALSDEELNCIPTFSKSARSESDPALNHTCTQHDNKNAYPAKKWPDSSKVPYVIDSNFNKSERCVLGYAMKKYHQNTCIRFVPRIRNDESDDFIQINRLDTPDFECNTLGLGYVKGKGAHTVNFSPRCFKRQSGTVMHELMHRLGFKHEHTRPDRDNYVQVNFKSIPDEKKSQYEIADSSTNLLQYDYGSVMHYRLSERMTKKKNTRSVEVGQRKSLSMLDVMKLNLMYCKI